MSGRLISYAICDTRSMLTVTSTRPRESREVMRFLIDGSSEASSEPTRRCISRNRLLTVLRSTETEKSSPATIALPYPVIDFMFFRIGPIGPVGPIVLLPVLLPRRQTEARRVFCIVRHEPAVPSEFPFRLFVPLPSLRSHPPGILSIDGEQSRLSCYGVPGC